MAQSVINIGNAANDGSGDPLRTAFDKCNDNFTELYAAVAAPLQPADLCRTKLAETADGTAGQVIAFSTQFVGTYALSIIDYNGIGIEVTAQDADGFTITSLAGGDFGYIALIEV